MPAPSRPPPSPAPSLHPAMKYAMGARVALGTRTVFNILGPLCNPAGVDRQLMGIFDGALTEKIAQVLQKLGSVHAMIVHGDDGLDEISTTAATKISHLQNDGNVNTSSIFGSISIATTDFTCSAKATVAVPEPQPTSSIFSPESIFVSLIHGMILFLVS